MRHRHDPHEVIARWRRRRYKVQQREKATGELIEALKATPVHAALLWMVEWLDRRLAR